MKIYFLKYFPLQVQVNKFTRKNSQKLLYYVIYILHIKYKNISLFILYS